MSQSRRPPSGPPQGGLPFDITKTTGVVCRKCKNPTFTECIFLRKVSKILSPEGEEGYIPIPTMMCTACGTMPPEMVPLFIIRELTGKTDEQETTGEGTVTPKPSEGTSPSEEPKEPISKGGLILMDS